MDASLADGSNGCMRNLRPRGSNDSQLPKRRIPPSEPLFQKCNFCQCILPGFVAKEIVVAENTRSVLLSCAHVSCQACFAKMYGMRAVSTKAVPHDWSQFKCPLCKERVHHIELPLTLHPFSTDRPSSLPERQREFEFLKNDNRTSFLFCNRHRVTANSRCSGCGDLTCEHCPSTYEQQDEHGEIIVHDRCFLSTRDLNLENSMQDTMDRQEKLAALLSDIKRRRSEFRDRTSILKNEICVQFYAIINATLGRLYQVLDTIREDEQKVERKLQMAEGHCRNAVRRIDVSSELDERIRERDRLPDVLTSDVFRTEAYNIFRPSDQEKEKAESILSLLNACPPELEVECGDTEAILEKVTNWGKFYSRFNCDPCIPVATLNIPRYKSYKAWDNRTTPPSLKFSNSSGPRLISTSMSPRTDSSLLYLSVFTDIWQNQVRQPIAPKKFPILQLSRKHPTGQNKEVRNSLISAKQPPPMSKSAPLVIPSRGYGGHVSSYNRPAVTLSYSPYSPSTIMKQVVGRSGEVNFNPLRQPTRPVDDRLDSESPLSLIKSKNSESLTTRVSGSGQTGQPIKGGSSEVPTRINDVKTEPTASTSQHSNSLPNSNNYLPIPKLKIRLLKESRKSHKTEPAQCDNIASSAGSSTSPEFGDREFDSDGSLKYCWVCNDDRKIEGEKGMCAGCPRVYHQKCHSPPITSSWEELPDNWLCSICELVDGCEISNEMNDRSRKLCCKVLLSCFRNHKDAAWFSQPVQDEDGYFEVIKKPMDFYTVALDLNASSPQQISTVSTFISRMNLIFQNCATFNDGTSEVAKAGKRVWKIYQEAVKKFLPNWSREVWLYISMFKGAETVSKRKSGEVSKTTPKKLCTRKSPSGYDMVARKRKEAHSRDVLKDSLLCSVDDNKNEEGIRSNTNAE